MMNNILDRIDDLITRIYCLKKCLQFTRIRDLREKEQDYRYLYINNEKPVGYYGPEPINYTRNQIKTAKYSILTFLPKNLFEQFRRVANFYFLINLIIQFAIPDAPISPYVSLLPLAFVILVTMVKQGYEDILRHYSDREINNTKARIIRHGQYYEVRWGNIKCGDIVEVRSDEEFPCDLILLWSSSTDKTCQVTTANLDGETNLKVKRVQNAIPAFQNPMQLATLRGTLVYDKPNPKLYEFKGKLIMNGQEFPLSNDNILLRASLLKVPTVIYGVAIYAGQDTKVMMNSKFKSNKMSCIERRLNKFIILFLLLLAVLTLILFGLTFLFDNIYKDHWYLTGSEPQYFLSNKDLYNFIVLVLYMNLLNYIIPLSLYVTVELLRFTGSQFIEWDLGMYDHKTDLPAKANSSDINEDLGQVEYLFSDKTGTLTENEMIFKQFATDNGIYEDRYDGVFRVGTSERVQLQSENMQRLFEIMSLCHSVQVDNRMVERYQASSPDEFSLLKFCERVGVVYLGESRQPYSNILTRQVRFSNQVKQYELLHVLEFDSERKCMSVIVKSLQNNQILLLTKGAETAIFEKSTQGNVQQFNQAISKFAQEGWRTLAFAYKVISQAEYQNYDRMLISSQNDLYAREQRMQQVLRQIESGLTVVGATGVEDKLQEDCAVTLENLRKAGIKIWVLTGDKKETAVNISDACKHFSPDMTKLSVTDANSPYDAQAQLYQAYNRVAYKRQGEKFALIIDGKTLVSVMDYFPDLFLSVSLECEAVLCCRMSPIQKAQVVKLIKKSPSHPLTAAIGDGANDVSMIQEAHVGVGIFGKEGRNAARASDFAIAKFKFLQRLLLVHGYLYYTRAAFLVQYFFYKNLAFSICQFYYAYFNAFSIQSLYNAIILTFYNISFTAAPIFFYGLSEQRVHMHKLEKNPYFYKTIRKNRILRYFEFLKWTILAIYHSLISFFFPYALFAATSSFSSDGKMSGRVELGDLVVTLIIVIVHLKLILETHYLSPIFFFSYSLSILSYVVFALIFNAFIMPSPLSSITDEQDLFWTFFDILSHASVWLLIILAVTVAILPDVLIKITENLIERNKLVNEKYNDLVNMYNGYMMPYNYGYSRLSNNSSSSSNWSNQGYGNGYGGYNNNQYSSYYNNPYTRYFPQMNSYQQQQQGMMSPYGSSSFQSMNPWQQNYYQSYNTGYGYQGNGMFPNFSRPMFRWF